MHAHGQLGYARNALIEFSKTDLLEFFNVKQMVRNA